MTNLIFDLEIATQGSQELSDRFVRAITGENIYLDGNVVVVLNPTRSLDDAVRFISDGWHVSHAFWDKELAVFSLVKRQSVYSEGTARTPPLALCLALLKAKENDNE
jgi:hypothetical protein